MQNHMNSPHGVTPALRMDQWAHPQFPNNHGQGVMFTSNPAHQGTPYMSLSPQYRSYRNYPGGDQYLPPRSPDAN